MTVSAHFHYQNNTLYAEGLALTELAKQFGTPLYIYSRQALKDAWQAYQLGMEDRNVLICFGMKANSNLAVLDQFRQLGSGFDIVSGGELERVLAIGGDPAKVVFSGVGKHRAEMEAALKAGIKCFNVESEDELVRLSDIATALQKTAPVSLRVNPDVDAKTHPYISTGLKDNKFGLPIEDAPRIYKRAQQLPNLKITGVDCHIGSQITQVAPYLDALDKLLDLIETLQAMGISIQHLDLGGGIGIRYKDEQPLTPKTLLDNVFAKLKARNLDHLQIILEPGRSLVGNAGVLLTTVEYLKHSEHKNFAVVDAAMNDLLRPTLYDAWHDVLAVTPRKGTAMAYDVVGPVCESGDWLAKNRELVLKQDDLLAVMSAGAYAFTMASQYNSRPRPAEIMVDGNQAHVVRQRETIESLFELEAVLP